MSLLLKKKCCCGGAEADPCPYCLEGTTPRIITVTFAGLTNPSCGGSVSVTGTANGTYDCVQQSSWWQDGGINCAWDDGSLYGRPLPPGLSGTKSGIFGPISGTALSVNVYYEPHQITVSAGMIFGNDPDNYEPLFLGVTPREFWPFDCKDVPVISNTLSCYNTGGTATLTFG